MNHHGVSLVGDPIDPQFAHHTPEMHFFSGVGGQMSLVGSPRRFFRRQTLASCCDCGILKALLHGYAASARGACLRPRLGGGQPSPQKPEGSILQRVAATIYAVSDFPLPGGENCPSGFGIKVGVVVGHERYASQATDQDQPDAYRAKNSGRFLGTLDMAPPGNKTKFCQVTVLGSRWP